MTLKIILPLFLLVVTFPMVSNAEVEKDPSLENGDALPISSESAGVQAQQQAGTPLSQDLLKLRDPFKMPVLTVGPKPEPKPVLERFPVDNFKLMGILTGTSRLRAMILGPDGNTYFISEGTKIGLQNGIVKKIAPNFIKIKEKFVNILGQEENIESEIRLPSERKTEEQVSVNTAQ